jgi:hypothetical protein
MKFRRVKLLQLIMRGWFPQHTQQQAAAASKAQSSVLAEALIDVTAKASNPKQ